MVMGHQAAELGRLQGLEDMRRKAFNRMHLVTATAPAPITSREATVQNGTCGLPESTTARTAPDTTSAIDVNPLANSQRVFELGGMTRLTFRCDMVNQRVRSCIA